MPGLTDLVTAGLDTRRHPHPRPSTGAGADPRRRQAARRALGQSLRQALADDGRAGAPGFHDRVAGARWRPQHRRASNPPSSRSTATPSPSSAPARCARDEIEAALGRPIAIAQPDAAIAAPGMLASHYAPNAAPAPQRRQRPSPAKPISASAPGEAPRATSRRPAICARRPATCFPCCMNWTHQSTRIAVAPIPHHGLGEAINDRLQRAAAPRPSEASPAPCTASGRARTASGSRDRGRRSPARRSGGSHRGRPRHAGPCP